MRKFWLLFTFLGFAPALGCNSTDTAGSQSLRVVATTGMIADAVQRVGGTHVAVDCLMGPGIDPHRYTPTSSDLAVLSRADLVFFNGLHLEGKMTDVLEGGGGTRAVAVSRNLDPSKDLRHGEGSDGAHDPHVWFDVRLWIKCVETIRDALVQADPPHAEEYRANAAAYLAELQALDAEVRAKAATIPADRRVLVTSHDAFGYFAAAYGFEVHGLQGVSTAAEVTTRDVQNLAQFLGTRRIPAVFGETSVPPKGLQKVLDAVKERYSFDVQLVGGDSALYSDALGPPGSPGETYIGMVRHNISVITDSLKK